MKKYLIIILAIFIYSILFIKIIPFCNKNDNNKIAAINNSTQSNDGITKPPDDDCCKALKAQIIQVNLFTS